jgi:CRISPR/Cas system CMR subunit Cmr4 (Cas7 group RAMP superfamily)
MWTLKPRGIRYRRVSPGDSQFNSMLDRYTEIERENRILLEKMTTIMS